MFAFGTTRSRQARSISSELTHAVTAYAALGDSTRVRILADSIFKVSRLSRFERDRRYPYYARGVYYGMVGRPADPVLAPQKAAVQRRVTALRAAGIRQ